jgi:predicted nucleotidyltransferase
MADDLLSTRRKFSEGQLETFRERTAKIPELFSQQKLSIYVTGSYGRLEAHRGSDLDLFFVFDGEHQIEKTTKILIDAELIKIAGAMGLPPFSGDAKYLEIHSLQEMLDKLGGAEDDFKNFFTARMLLLLESRPVYGDAAYKRIMTQIIDAYFRDYHDHTGDFRPLFLVNDILRFWKTLCLNYENRRNRPEDRAEKNKHHVKNLKLKFSRLLICFSTIIPLFATRSNSPEEILTLTGLPPLERIGNLSRTDEQKSLYNQIRALYEVFLEITAKPDIQEWIGDRENRKAAFAKADKFGSVLFSFLKASMTSPDDVRFLIV